MSLPGGRDLVALILLSAPAFDPRRDFPRAQNGRYVHCNEPRILSTDYVDKVRAYLRKA
jgi:hypothetical protein